MKKNGFILIEVLVSLCILTILFTVGISLLKLGENISSDIRNSGYLYEIQNLLSYGKAICKEKNQYGKLTVNYKTNEIKFVEPFNEVEKIIKLPKDLKFIKDLSVFVTPDGKIEQGGTIMFVDKWGERHDITIGVGIDLIIVKGE